MPRRAILLFVLFLVLSLFYASFSTDQEDSIFERYEQQAERLNQLDEAVLSEQGGEARVNTE
jgi:preprotein translocase subunit SecG